VANKPILFYGIEALAASGIREIGIVVGETHQEIRDAVGDGSRFGVSVTYIQQDAPLGLAHAVLVSEPFLGSDPFCMYLGDNLIREKLEPLVTRFRDEKPQSQILLARVPDPTQFGVAELRDGNVVRLIEKPKIPPSDLALVGVYMFDATVFRAVKAIKPSPRGELEITDAIQWLIDQGHVVRPHIIEGWWKDTGKLEDMLEANRIILDALEPRTDGAVEDSDIAGKVVVEAGARIVKSTVRGPAIIGKGAVIESAYIGPFTSIGDGVVVHGSEIEYSIVLEGASISDIGGRIESSLIGRNVSIHPSPGKPRSFKFMLGDRSEVGLV
jgi:glucose-1-phosphate thymidylyltransferase